MPPRPWISKLNIVSSDRRLTVLFNAQHNNNDNDKNDNDINGDIDEFLDKQIFDPEAVTEDDPAPIQWFANLVKNDYATAEVLYAGAMFVVLVVFSQELLRMQLYGDGYVPFQAGVKPGQLF